MIEHALLSASGSSMWLNCTPSVRFCEHMPKTTSSYAEEGSLAHNLAELKLRKTFESMPKSTFSGRLNKLKKQELFQQEMLEHTDTYVDTIIGLTTELESPKIIAESRVNYQEYAPEGFGTADCVIIGKDKLIGTKKLIIVDFKYGKGEFVDVEHNTQLMLYALGAYSEYSILYEFDTVTLGIVQPRLEEPVRFWSTPLSELLAWGEYIKPIAQKAFNGKGEFVAGEHCRWCPAKSTCKVRANLYLGLEQFMPAAHPNTLTGAEIGGILTRGESLASWFGELQDFALAEILRGGTIDGWKAVEGRSNRIIKDITKAFGILNDNGFTGDKLYETSPIGITKLENLVGNKRLYLLINEFIEKPQGKPTLAVASDKREAFIPNGSAKDDFKEV